MISRTEVYQFVKKEMLLNKVLVSMSYVVSNVLHKTKKEPKYISHHIQNESHRAIYQTFILYVLLHKQQHSA